MAAEFGQLAGVPPRRVWQLAAREDSPKPAAVRGAGRVWCWRDLERWGRGVGPVAEGGPTRRTEADE
jgi:hypothetical protein